MLNAPPPMLINGVRTWASGQYQYVYSRQNNKFILTF